MMMMNMLQQQQIQQELMAQRQLQQLRQIAASLAASKTADQAARSQTASFEERAALPSKRMTVETKGPDISSTPKRKKLREDKDDDWKSPSSLKQRVMPLREKRKRPPKSMEDENDEIEAAAMILYTWKENACGVRPSKEDVRIFSVFVGLTHPKSG